jgi:hypothetical protein
LNDLILINTELDQRSHYTVPIEFDGIPSSDMIALWDSNGYDFSELEKLYASANDQEFCKHREHRFAIRKVWMESPPTKVSGAVINHALLFERKGYAGAAYKQLKQWASTNPQLHKILQLKPKWGLDFSIDFTDSAGRVFEILHFEYDDFNITEIESRIEKYTEYFMSIDWDQAGEEIWDLRFEWKDLDFEQQSAFKCDYFGIEHEAFKKVAWNVD